MLSRHLLFVLGPLCLLAPILLGAAPPAPPPPETYDVQIRYRINAFRNEHVVQYDAMMRYLQGIGFRRAADDVVGETEPEDATHTLLRGTIPAKRALDLLNERHVQSVLLMPHGAKPPEDASQMVRVDLRLADGLAPEAQRLLSEQTFEVLAGIQFRGAVGYDHRGYTRLVGSLPYNRLPTLLTDLRALPAGGRQPGPFKNVWAVRLTEVLPGMPLPAPRPRPPQVPKGQEKLSPELRDALADAGGAAKPARLEVILASAPGPEDKSWIGMLGSAAPGLVVEGRLGPLVTVLATPAQAPALAALPAVAAVRLPRTPQPAAQPAAAGRKEPDWQPLLKAAGVARLHALGCRGRGTRLAVIDSDFRGWEALRGKGLPPDTRLIDLTRERNPDFSPDPYPAEGPPPGAGTRHALTIARVAPEVDLTLVRIDPAAPYMLDAVARSINGDVYRSLNLENRLAEIDREQALLDRRREALQEERRAVLDEFYNAEERDKRLIERAEKDRLTPEQVEKLPEFEKLPESAKRYVLYWVRQKAFDREERAHNRKLQDYLLFQRDLRSLRGVRVVASGLAWNEGFPVDGTSTLSRYFDDRPFRAALWFQAAGDTRGQSWTGVFRDADGNGVMEFAPPGRPLPPSTWTPELNFLSWQTPDGKTVADIPAGANFRISLQWREAHDPSYAQAGEDPYREPLARLRLALLYQPDPAGKKQPADDLEVIPLPVNAPQRLDVSPNSATYEVVLDVQVKKPGRYAVRVEGRPPETIYPAGAPVLPVMRRAGELRLRLFVAPLGGGGRAILHDFATDGGSVGMPADARMAITVGAADARGRRQPYSGGGVPFNLELLSKPEVLAYDVGEGTAEAAAFAAGVAAAAHGVCPTRAACLEGLQVRPGGVLRVPPGGRQR